MRKRRIKKAKIRFISLVKRGANWSPVIYKSDNKIEFNPIIKEGENFEEQGELLCAFYPSERRDADGDIASPEVVKDFAYDFLQSGANIDIDHNGKALDKSQAFVAESFINKGDSRFANYTDYDGNPIDIIDDWCGVIKINDPDIRKKYKEDGWNGVSIGGEAVFETEDSESSESSKKSVKALIKEQLEEKKNMDEILKKLEALAAAMEKIAETKVPAKKEDPAPEDTKKTFTGDPTDAEAVKKHLLEIKKKKVLSEINWENAKEVEKYLEGLSEDPQEPREELEKKIEELQGELENLEKGSAQPLGKELRTPNQSARAASFGLSPRSLALIEAGKKMAKALNESK